MASRDGFVERRTVAGSPTGALCGLRLAVKDNIQVDGLAFTAGHPLFERRKAHGTATAVQWLIDAGVSVVGTTFTDAGGFGVTTPSVVNPLSPSLVAGGSSGGVAVAVATSNADLGIGTDTGGSVRIPAACCGLYAFKPSFGLVPLDRVWPMARSFDHIGILSNGLNCLADASRTLLDESQRYLKGKSQPRKLRIGIDREPPVFRSDWAVSCMHEVVERIRAAGHSIVRVDLPDRETCIEAHGIVTLFESSSVYACFSEGEKGLLGKAAITALRAARGLSEAKVQKARDRLNQIRFETAKTFGRADALLLPTLPMRPPRVQEKLVTIRGKSLAVLHALVYETCLFNVCGLPVVSIPFANAKNENVPFSVQLISEPFSDYELLASAAHIDAALNQ